ncbi:hypothetical protein [Polaribacter ponticola]|uniref:DUF1080 domain-containing protein n=1 Tax=Polaribacter ponticola TaxID=2978475 RepID=A0ABT5S6W5_9FLAO|nr:hypothetical protein [Polaribacter sp. MSW5]MDD7913838.1 hypothetical protein [Polaribacter sp. MSW5]
MIKNFENGKSKTIKEWTVSEHIKKGNSYNYLEVKHINNTFEYYINNKLVYTNYAAKMYGDRLGFIVYNRQKISVGYLSVNYINKKVKSKISLEKDIVFLDEFNNNSNNWNELNNESVNFYFSDGNYYLDHKKDETGYLAYINKNFDSSKDFEIETKFKHVSGDTNSPYGLLWGKKDENYLQILLTATGYYKVKRVINNKNEEIIKWVKSSAINIGSGKSNILKVKKEGEYYKLFINSTYLTKIDFEAFFGSEIGYGIYYKQKIAIDYLKINQDKTNIIKPTKKDKTLTVPLYDSFNSNTNNWNLDNASDYSVAINNGKLNLKRKKVEVVLSVEQLILILIKIL